MNLFRRFLAASAAESDDDSCGRRGRLERYLSLWFQGVGVGEIRRGNMEELMAYGEL
jgi:hypothetical protein